MYGHELLSFLSHLIDLCARRLRIFFVFCSAHINAVYSERYPISSRGYPGTTQTLCQEIYAVNSAGGSAFEVQ